MEKKKKCCDWLKIEDETYLKKLIEELKNWKIIMEKATDGNEFPLLRKKIKTENFVSAIEYFNKIAKIAEEKNHHPDLHLTRFKNIQIDVYTYSLKGLTENDFNLAKAIDQIPI